MISFKDYLQEGVADAAMIRRKPLSKRTDKEQAFLNAQKASKPQQGKVEVHIKHEDGTISKEKFKLKKHPSEWENEAQTIANGHLKNLQMIHDKFPTISGSKAKEVHKVMVK